MQTTETGTPSSLHFQRTPPNSQVASNYLLLNPYHWYPLMILFNLLATPIKSLKRERKYKGIRISFISPRPPTLLNQLALFCFQLPRGPLKNQIPRTTTCRIISQGSPTVQGKQQGNQGRQTPPREKMDFNI